jgi:hypothetical protein
MQAGGSSQGADVRRFLADLVGVDRAAQPEEGPGVAVPPLPEAVLAAVLPQPDERAGATVPPLPEAVLVTVLPQPDEEPGVAAPPLPEAVLAAVLPQPDERAGAAVSPQPVEEPGAAVPAGPTPTVTVEDVCTHLKYLSDVIKAHAGIVGSDHPIIQALINVMNAGERLAEILRRCSPEELIAADRMTFGNLKVLGIQIIERLQDIGLLHALDGAIGLNVEVFPGVTYGDLIAIYCPIELLKLRIAKVAMAAEQMKSEYPDGETAVQHLAYLLAAMSGN